MIKTRLDQAITKMGLASTRSQANSYIGLGKVKVNGVIIKKSGYLVSSYDKLEMSSDEQFVSRAALKIASVAEDLGLNFKDKIVLDVGSSTGGFSDFALRRGASRVIAVEVGTEQMHPSLVNHPKIELHEKTDIREFKPSSEPDIIVMDVSFISLRQILPSVVAMSSKSTDIVAMLKPQFEATQKDINKGVIKNDTLRRKILKDFELWTKPYFQIAAKADSKVAGAKGNLERFYLLRKLS